MWVVKNLDGDRRGRDPETVQASPAAHRHPHEVRGADAKNRPSAPRVREGGLPHWAGLTALTEGTAEAWMQRGSCGQRERTKRLSRSSLDAYAPRWRVAERDVTQLDAQHLFSASVFLLAARICGLRKAARRPRAPVRASCGC